MTRLETTISELELQIRHGEIKYESMIPVRILIAEAKEGKEEIRKLREMSARLGAKTLFLVDLIQAVAARGPGSKEIDELIEEIKTDIPKLTTSYYE